MVYHIIKLASKIFLRFYLGFRVTGKGHVPRKGAFILAANHSSYLDPFIMAASVGRTLHFIAREKLLYSTAIGRVLRYANTIPVKRHGRDISVIKKSLRILKKGGALGIFPEGTRAKDRKLKRAKSGVGMLVYKGKVPVVPVYIEGAFDAMPRGLKTLKCRVIKVHIGKPIRFRDERAGEQGKDVYQSISDEIMRHIAELGKRQADQRKPAPA